MVIFQHFIIFSLHYGSLYVILVEAVFKKSKTKRNVVYVSCTSNAYVQAKQNVLVIKTFSKQSNESSQHNTLTNPWLKLSEWYL